MLFKKMLGKKLLSIMLRGTMVGQDVLHLADGLLEDLRIELELRYRVRTLDDLADVMAKHGWHFKKSEDGRSYPQVVAIDIETVPWTAFSAPVQAEQEVCDECGNTIPPPQRDGESIVNEHHKESCSLYEDPVSMNSGC
jgi:hypothetical protein